MQLQVPNKKLIRTLSLRSLRKNKVRNCVAILAIALTVILFTTVFTLAIGMQYSLEQSSFRLVGGYAHGGFKEISMAQYEQIKRHTSVKNTGVSKVVGLAENPELLKALTEIRYMDQNSQKWTYNTVQVGKEPILENEVATNTSVLDLLGVPHELGAQVPVSYVVDGKTITQMLTLTGYWKKEQGVDVNQILISEALVDQLRPNAPIFVDVMFDSSFDIEGRIVKVIQDLGYPLEGEGAMRYGVNWAYSNARGMSESMIVIGAILGGSLLIMFTGYLIIYNIFQISVMNDIRFYGLLKTIGTTPKQIKKIVMTQAFGLSVIGIPIGLLLGYMLGKGLLPFVMQSSNYKVAYVPTSPIIFVGAALFGLLTVYISCHKPSKMVGRISPIEAAKYSEVTNYKKPRKGNSGSVGDMAWRNISRNKKKSSVVILSMCLSLVLLNSIYTYTEGFDMDKYLQKFVVSDFILAHANYFNVGKGFHEPEDVPSEQYIKAVMERQGIVSGGGIYYDLDLLRELKADTFAQLYGFDEAILDYMKVLEGEIDLGKLSSGKYILEIVNVNDYGEPYPSPYAVGDKISIQRAQEESVQYEILAQVTIPHNASVRYSFSGSTSFYLPIEVFTKQVNKPLMMAYYVEVEDAYEEQLQAFISEYTTQVDDRMSYESRQSYMNDFEGMKKTYTLVGGAMSLIIGLIGIVNFINVMITSIMTRRGEFAILQSIGMTTKQLRRMLIMEGLLYSVMTLAWVYVGSILASYLIVKTLGEGLWFFTYQFSLLPVAVVTPILVILGGLIPYVIYGSTSKQTIVEKLREIS
ncbi:MAG: ABC transporter permease [Cellulosilyticaceae bacterium]